jgi:hypothetical protein
VEREAHVPALDPDTPAEFSIEPALHAGLTFDPKTGGISGTAEVYDGVVEALTTEHTVTAKNSGGEVATKLMVTVKYQPPPEFEAPTREVIVKREFSFESLLPVNPLIPVNWSAIAGDPLPDGCTLDPDTGVLSGTPEETTELLLVIKAENSGGEFKVECEFYVFDEPPTAITYDPMVVAIAEVGIKEGGAAPAVTPDTPIESFSIQPSLPDGLKFDVETGAITGVPDEDGVGETEHTVTATNSGGEESTKITVTVLEPPPANLSYNRATNLLSFRIHDAESAAPKHDNKGTFSITPELPVGLTFTELGVIEGTVEDESLYDTSDKYVVTLTNSGGECSVEVTIEFPNKEREFDEIPEHEIEMRKKKTWHSGHTATVASSIRLRLGEEKYMTSDGEDVTDDCKKYMWLKKFLKSKELIDDRQIRRLKLFGNRELMQWALDNNHLVRVEAEAEAA